MIRIVSAVLLVAALASGQVTYLGLVGTPQAVPDPYFLGGSGFACISGQYCPGIGLGFTLWGLPLGYNTGSAVTQEQIWFVIDAGTSSLPGVNILGGQFYIPFTSPVSFNAGSSRYLGPGGIPCTGIIPFPGPPFPYTANGASVNLGPIPPGTFGLLTVQGFLLDPAINRAFTSNAINLSFP